MKCPKCGFEREDCFSFCPKCGSAVGEAGDGTSPVQSYVNPVAQRILAMLNSPLYLAVCILSSAAAMFNLYNKNFPLIGILITIFLWLIFANAKKGFADSDRMRCVSGAIFAQYVLIWVAVGFLVAVGGVVCLVFANPAGRNMLLSALYNYNGSYVGTLADLMSISLLLPAIIVVIIASVAAMINIFGIRSVHRFAKSLYESAASGNLAVIKRSAAQGWLMVFGIFSAIGAVCSAFGDGVSFLASACYSAVCIIGSVLIGKYFSDCR